MHVLFSNAVIVLVPVYWFSLNLDEQIVHTNKGEGQLAFFKHEIIQTKFSTKKDNVLLTPFPLILHNLFISPFLFHFITHIDPTSTQRGPYIDPISALHWPYFNPTSTPHRPYIDISLHHSLFVIFKSISIVNSEVINNHHLHISFFPSTTNTTLLLYIYIYIYIIITSSLGIACENIRFSTLFASGDVSRRGTSAT